MSVLIPNTHNTRTPKIREPPFPSSPETQVPPLFYPLEQRANVKIEASRPSQGHPRLPGAGAVSQEDTSTCLEVGLSQGLTDTLEKEASGREEYESSRESFHVRDQPQTPDDPTAPLNLTGAIILRLAEHPKYQMIQMQQTLPLCH